MCTHKTAIRKQCVADLDMYEIIEPITFYKPTRDSHFKQSQPWNLLLKDMVDRGMFGAFITSLHFLEIRFERVSWKGD